jgi:hypothetical protein
VAVRLQPHNTVAQSSGVANLTGENFVPAWEPSQKGWRRLLPHEHQK